MQVDEASFERVEKNERSGEMMCVCVCWMGATSSLFSSERTVVNQKNKQTSPFSPIT